MSQLLFWNILVSLLKTKINLEEYQCNHKFGKIGESFKKVKELLIYKYPTIILNDKIDITNILYTMNNYKLGCCFFLDNKKKLIGILTDKDIRELFIKNIKYIDISNINTSFYSIYDENKYIKDIKKYNIIPVLNKDNTINGIIKLNKLW